MTTCTNHERGKLLPLYEANDLDQQQILEFEEHLLECEFCYQELRQSLTFNRLLAIHNTELRRHYSETGATFADEIRSMTNSRDRAKSSTWFGTLSTWFADRPTMRLVLPTVAVAAISFLIVLSDNLPLDKPALDPKSPIDRQITDILSNQTADKSDSSISSPAVPGDDIDQTEATTRVDMSPYETQAPDHADGKAQERAADRDRDNLIASLSPSEAIPYTPLTTRGDAATQELAAFKVAMQLYENKVYDSSASLLRELVLKFPNNVTYLTYFGSSLYMTGDFQGAAVALTKVTRQNGEFTDARVRLFLAVALVKVSRENEAKQILQRLAREPNRTLAAHAADLLRALE